MNIIVMKYIIVLYVQRKLQIIYVQIVIFQQDQPFLDFNYKEKTFLPFNKNVDYLLPDFNRQHPEVTFFVKSKSRFEKVNYLPKPIENENIKYLRRKYLDNKYNFNMPGMGISLSYN